MDQTVLLWILTTTVGLLTAVIGGMIWMMISHAGDCRDYRVANATHNGSVDAKLERIIRDIGDHDSGMRGDIHDLRKQVTPFVIMAQAELERRNRSER